jgi:tripartite-type tricarboxylate transporter receptor subunit TctC
LPKESYPSHVLDFVVPAPSDVLVRLIGQKSTERWARPVVIEFRSGANTEIGAATEGHQGCLTRVGELEQSSNLLLPFCYPTR